MVFEIHVEGPALGSLMPPATMERAVILRSGTSKIMLLWRWMFDPRLTLDGFKDILDRSFSGAKLSSTQ